MNDRRLPWWIALLTMLLFLPTLRLGFLADFYWFPAMDSGVVTPNYVDFPSARAWWHGVGLDAWWASDDFRWNLWRPLSTRLLFLQWDVFGSNALGFHAVSLATYVAMLAPVWLLYREFLRPRVAALALLLFGSHFSHLQTVWFHSNQHSLFSVFPALLGFLAHRRWRRGWAPGLPLSLAGMALGLGSGETALGMAGYWLCNAAAEEGTLRSRILSLAPIAVLLAAYLGAHHALGYTTHGSLIYLDPSGGMGDFLRNALPRLPALLTGCFNVLPADIWTIRPPLRPLQTLAAGILSVQLLLLGRMAWSSWTADERSGALLSLGGMLALLPATASFPGGRLLLGATIGSSLLLALLFQQVFSSGTSYRLLVAPLALMNLLLPGVILGRFGPLYQMDAGIQETAINAEIVDTLPTLVVCLPSEDIALNLLSVRYVYGHHPFPPAWWLLSAAAADHRLTRLGPNTLELEVLNGHLLGEEDTERLFRPASWPMRAGDRYAQAGLEVEVEAVDDVGPTRLRYSLPQPLERYQVLSWQNGELRKLQLPDVGNSVVLPWSATPYR